MVIFCSTAMRSARGGWVLNRPERICPALKGATMKSEAVAGETSMIAIRLMGLGKPVMMSAGQETSRFPESACVRVDTGQAEEEMLASTIVWLDADRGAARDIGKRAAQHIAEEHALDRIAGRYREILLGVST